MSNAVSWFMTCFKSLLQTKCFLCGIGSEYFDKVPHGFETHTLQEHNLANYLWVDSFWPSCLMLSQCLNLILKLLMSLSMLSLKMHTIAVIERSVNILHLFCKITLRKNKTTITPLSMLLLMNHYIHKQLLCELDTIMQIVFLMFAMIIKCRTA